MSKIYLPLLDIENILPILNMIPILGGLTEKQLYTVFRNLEKVSYKKNEIIFEEGDTPSHIYIVRSGRVKIVKKLKSPSPLEWIEIQLGQSFGESALIGIEPHTASAIAMEATELIVLSSKGLRTIHKEDMELFCMIILNIARELSRRLNQTENTLLHYFAH